MKLLEKICEELGVRINEKWTGNDGGYYRIIDTGELIQIEYNTDPALDIRYFEIIDDISRVLTGKLKPMWKPKIDEDYWAVDFTEDDNVWSYIWSNDDFDNRLLHKDIVFKTKEEAIACAKKMLEVAKEG